MPISSLVLFDSLLTTHPPPCIIVEDQNFALFNYVNELNGEMEMVQEQIKEVCVCVSLM